MFVVRGLITGGEEKIDGRRIKLLQMHMLSHQAGALGTLHWFNDSLERRELLSWRMPEPTLLYSRRLLGGKESPEIFRRRPAANPAGHVAMRARYIERNPEWHTSSYLSIKATIERLFSRPGNATAPRCDDRQFP
jgi:hypothetical protein